MKLCWINVTFRKYASFRKYACWKYFKRFQMQNKVYWILSHQHIHSFSTIISCFIHKLQKSLSRIRGIKNALAEKDDRSIYNNELLFENLSMPLLCLKPKKDLKAFWNLICHTKEVILLITLSPSFMQCALSVS